MKKKQLIRFFIGIGVIVLLNFLANQFFFRIDLTEDQRYTIAPATERLLEKLEEPVFITVYLEGNDIPPAFKRLRTTVKEKLEEFTAYAGNNIRFRFEDITQETDKKKLNERIYNLIKKGIQPTNLVDKEGGSTVERLIIPGAMVSYEGKEAPVMLLRGNQRTKGLSSEQILNQSVENVEYELASAIRQLTNKERKRIGIIQGYGNLRPIQMADMITSLQKFYDVFLVPMQKQPELKGLDAIIVAKPDSAFSEEDKYKIDQFIVNGGKALFFVDALKSDTILRGESTLLIKNDLNLDDLFFRYGVRLNDNVIQDLTSSGAIPMTVGNMGSQPQVKLMPWRFFPLVNTFSKHPIVRNLDAVYLHYVGTIDTVKAVGIQKTPLMFTSPYSKVNAVPAQIDFNEARLNPDPRQYRAGPQSVAYLLEGKFHSLYANRITQVDPRFKTFKEYGNPSKIIICSDGDLPANEIDPKTGKPAALGYDQFMNTTFANKDFILHAVDYLIDENGVIAARAKEVVLRPLDKLKVQEERLQWQLINLLLPIVVIVILGLIRAYWRKRKYAV
ncbi:gliding motility-associated ABC transporter substrate-binding protein GldG [Cytophagaceae bacterium YF14B1]|uniref:Gliding motility-associated ABC transporter substrate-binding protein GldG n=1 Tax=Xanthocytophaga flava TaxID=3048013 RepID=A0AAE3U7W7_9BACT|nr:gliding motility-associated ABC transporter substrate-binding protein GldG [Xanthocytophaga flavus]MDJ1483374.1 gliding motility-associated ABC transporter substrate-binding protein GldG [Xanthocytophaga flavus]